MGCHRYFYSGATFAVTELDGVRVIGQEVSDFIQKVPGMDERSDGRHCNGTNPTASIVGVCFPTWFDISVCDIV